VGLSDSYGSLGYLNILPAGDVFPKAKAAAETALKLDDTLGEAHAALGHALMRGDWDLKAAEVELDRAIALNPRYGIAHHWRAHLAIATGHSEDILPESRRAVELEPLDLMLNAHLIFMLASRASREPAVVDELLARIASVREIEPEFWAAHTVLGGVHLAKRELDRAREEFALGIARSNGMPLALSFMGRAYAAAGFRKEAEEAVAALQRRAYVPAGYIAGIVAGLGDTDRALTWLERAVDQRESGIIELKSPVWPAAVREHPRYHALIRRMGLQ
jgi:tetratricopeptide (TPR) repeat protein